MATERATTPGDRRLDPDRSSSLLPIEMMRRAAALAAIDDEILVSAPAALVAERRRGTRATTRLVWAAVAVLLLTACDGTEDPGLDRSPGLASPAATSVAPAPANGGTIVLRQDGCRLEPGPSPLRAGPVTFDVQNRTGELGAANIALLEGVSFSRFERHIRKEISLALADEPVLGYPPFAVPIIDVVVEPGTTARLESDLVPGTYVLACARTYGRVDDLRPSGALGPVEVAG